MDLVLWSFLTLLVLLGSIQSQSVQPHHLTPTAVDAVGTEFTIFFQENAARRTGVNFDLQLFLTTHVSLPVKVRVSLPLLKKSSSTFKEVTVHKGNVTEVTFPQNMVHLGTGKSNRGIHILANEPIVVYGINPQRFSSEGFIAIPNHLLGTEYYAVGMPAEDHHSQLGAVAVEPGHTEITVTLPDNTELEINFDGRRYSANDVIVTNLTQYQTFQLQHRNSKRGKPDGDLSGAKIQCTKRCAAFSGNSRTSVSGASRDLLVEQLPPVSTWGREFAVPPTPMRTDRPDILKIVCQQDGTTVLVDDSPHGCNEGGSVQLEISTSTPHYVTATKPVMVATVVMSQNGTEAAIQADPAMTLIIPEEQYAQTYTVATATWSGAALDGKAYNNFLTVVLRRDQIDQVMIDGMNVNIAFPATVWTDVPATAVGGRPALVTAYFNITPGTHTISTLNNDGAKLMCIVYGAGDRESYAYMGGMRLKVINPACTQVLQATYGDGVDNDCDARIDEELCDNTDDDGDGSIDEDCVVKNAVRGLGDVTSFVEETPSLKWNVFAINYAAYKTLRLYKQQPTATRVLLAEGNGTLSLTSLFDQTSRYSVTVSQAVKRGELFIVEVELTISGATIADPGNYTLEYTAQDGVHDGVNNLDVQQRNQYYEIIARDLVSGSTQYARSSQPEPRHLYLNEGRNYSITFHSVGGQYLDDLPYRQFFARKEETSKFDVIGLQKNYVTGAVTGMQNVRSVYELVYQHMTALRSHDKVELSVRNADMTVVVSALLNIESSVRPEISCEFKADSDTTGHIACDITKVKIDIKEISWDFDDNQEKIISSSVSGPYNVSHKVSANDSSHYIASIDGLSADQWPANTRTRKFEITVKQKDGFTLSRQITIPLNAFPNPPGLVESDILCSTAVSLDGKSPSYITCTTQGGGQPITNVVWQVDTEGDNFTLTEGKTRTVYSSSNFTESRTKRNEYSVTLVINRPIREEEHYILILRRGGTEGTVKITINRSAYTQGKIEGDIVRDPQTGEVAIVAEVVGGQPKPNNFTWRVQLNDGTYDSYPAGSGDATPVTINGRGNPSTTLNVNQVTSTRTFTLNSSAVDNGVVLWWTSHSWTVHPSSAVTAPPSTACSLRSHNVQIGEELELVCTVRTNTTIEHIAYTNILPNGTIREISANTTESGFRYTKTVNPDGSLDVSLFFTLTKDILSISVYNFTIYYPGGRTWTSISLQNVLRDMVSKPDQKYISGTEGSRITLTCNIQAGDQFSLDTMTWKRRSLGESKMVQTVSSGRNIKRPFKNERRFSVTGRVTPDGFLSSTLQILNLKGGDVGEYFCLWSNSVSSNEFVLDVIEHSLEVNGQRFTNQQFYDNQRYRLKYEFRSVFTRDYLVKYGGVLLERSPVVRNATRYDSFSGEHVPVNVYTVLDDSFSPADVFVIKTLYKDSRSEEPNREEQIRDYILSKTTTRPEVDRQDDSTFVGIYVNDVVYPKNENIVVFSGIAVNISIVVSAPSCTQEIKIAVGSVDVTSSFTRSEESNGIMCTITLSRSGFIGRTGDTIRIISVNTQKDVILSENIIRSTNPPPRTTPYPSSDRTQSTVGPHECSVLNGGCDYICERTELSYQCACPSGLMLSANGKSCIDEDECTRNPCGKTEQCINTFGSYHCLPTCNCDCCDAKTTTPVYCK